MSFQCILLVATVDKLDDNPYYLRILCPEVGCGGELPRTPQCFLVGRLPHILKQTAETQTRQAVLVEDGEARWKLAK